MVICAVGVVNAQCVVPDTPFPTTPVGPDIPCEGAQVTYSVNSSKNATSYSWFYPADWVVVSGASTRSITFIIGQTSGNIGVYGVNSCGSSYNSSQRNIQITKKPSTPSKPSSYNANCSSFVAQWSTDGTTVDYLVDVSTDENFESFVGKYKAFNVGNVQNVLITGLVSSTKYYYRIRRQSSCGISPNYSESDNTTTAVGSKGGVVEGVIGRICAGSNSGILNLRSHDGSVQKWQMAVSPFTTWSDIPNTSTTYTSGSLSSTTQFRAVIKNGDCISFSSPKEIIVDVPAKIDEHPTALTICQNAPAILTVSTTGSKPLNFQWYRNSTNSNSSGTIINGATNSTYIPSTATMGTVYYYVVVTGCNIVVSNQAAVTVNANLNAGTISFTSNSICVGTTATSSSNGNTGGVWSSSSPSVATVDSVTGIVTGIAAGTSTITYTLSSGCGSPKTASATVSVNPNVSAGTVSFTSNSICTGATAASISNGNTGGVWSSGNTSVATVNSSTGVVTGIAAGTSVISYTLNSGCGSQKTASAEINVNPILTASVAITVPTNIICKGSPSSFTFTAVPAHGGAAPSYQWKVNGNYKGSNNSVFTTTELLEGDVVTVEMTSNATPCLTNSPVASKSITIETKTTQYNNITGWTIEPTPNLSAEIQTDYSLNVNLEVCALKITNNAVVKINAENYFKIQNGLDVSAGTLTVESDANLIQVNPIAVNKGIITVKRDLKFSAARQQYNYLISPVKNVSLKDIYKNATGGPVTVPFVLYHNEANNKFYTSSGAYIAGRALAVKEATAAAFPGGAGTIMKATFTGEPMNGNLSYTLINSKPEDSNRGFNLIGNPYPSNLDLDAFYNENAEHLSPTFNFWDSTANDTYIQAGDGYPGQAYAQWNAATPPGEGSGTKATGDITGTKEPTRYVKVGQGFMARTTAASKIITFKNIMRSKEVSQGFFGKGARGAVPFDRYWLNMTSPSNITSQIAMVYFEGGDNGYTKEDSRSLGGSDAIYSIVEGQQISINGKNSFMNTDVQPLGSKHFVSGNYKIALGDQLDGIFANGQSIYLKDKQVGIITNLSQGSYTFAANAGESTGRFEIIYQPETVLATEGVKKENLLVYRDGSDFVVKSSTKKITSIQVLDTSGRLILRLQPNEIMARIKADSLSNGIYILKIEQGNQVSAKKIIK